MLDRMQILPGYESRPPPLYATGILLFSRVVLCGLVK